MAARGGCILVGIGSRNGAPARGAAACGDDVECAPRRTTAITVAWSVASLDSQASCERRSVESMPGAHILNVACGSGVKSFVLAQADPSARVKAIDSPKVLEVTANMLRRWVSRLK